MSVAAVLKAMTPGREFTAEDIANRAKMPKSEVRRYLVHLVRKGEVTTTRVRDVAVYSRK